jgi:ribose transport system substrate-binding protein
MKFNQFKFLAAALALALVTFGCGKKEGPTETTAKKLKLAFVANNSSSYWTIAQAGTEEAKKELGNVDVDFRMPATATVAEQQQMLDDLLAKGEDGIAASPLDAANQTDFLNKVADETLFITTDSDAPLSKRVCYIGTDNIAAGREAGKLIKEVLPNGGKIMMFVGTMDAQNAKDRYTGITNELAGSNIQVIDVRTDETDRSRAQRNVEDTLVKYPDVACLVGLYSYNGPAILNAVKSANKVGAVKIVCFDEEDETLAGVADGSIYGTIVQQPFEFGKQSILKMAAYIRGDKSALAGGQQIVPTLSLKKDNVAEYSAKLKAMLGK